MAYDAAGCSNLFYICYNDPHMTTVRTRFAPSPTGALHGGTIRTALFAWLVARHHGGQFLLRIEDTDQVREVPGAVDNIIQSLQWLGLQWDEGPDVGGEYGPYTQSQRLDIYKKYAQQLIDAGHAYADPYSQQELQALREQAQAAKQPFLYRNHRPENPPAWDGMQPLRLKVNVKPYSWDDAVMGTIHMGPEMVDDFIVIKSDGFPTYNFAHIIDDYLMKITHVFRSQEFLSSIPKYLALYEALGWQPPINAIMPPVLDETGKRKLSKRFGAEPILSYRDRGYTPEAMLNFLATMGWNDGTEQEIFSRSELIEKFSLDRVQKSGAKFDEERLRWMNGHWIRSFSLDELYNRVQNFWPKEAASANEEYKKHVLSLVHERLKFFAELPELTHFFFTDPAVGEELFAPNKQTKKLSSQERNDMLQAVIAELEQSDFSETDLEERMRGLVEKLGTKPGTLFSLVRSSITGSLFAPGLFETLHVLGKDVALRRLKNAILH